MHEIAICGAIGTIGPLHVLEAGTKQHHAGAYQQHPRMV